MKKTLTFSQLRSLVKEDSGKGRKIKHWQGYGTVFAKKIRQDDDTLVIQVRGMHEYGLETKDKYHVFDWLVKRFDKVHTDYADIESVETDDDYVPGPNGTEEEVCTYTIHFRNPGNATEITPDFWKRWGDELVVKEEYGDDETIPNEQVNEFEEHLRKAQNEVEAAARIVCNSHNPAAIQAWRNLSRMSEDIAGVIHTTHRFRDWGDR